MSKRHENERSCSWLIVHCSVTFLVLVTILDFLFARFISVYIIHCHPFLSQSGTHRCHLVVTGDTNFNKVTRMAR